MPHHQEVIDYLYTRRRTGGRGSRDDDAGARRQPIVTAAALQRSKSALRHVLKDPAASFKSAEQGVACTS